MPPRTGLSDRLRSCGCRVLGNDPLMPRVADSTLNLTKFSLTSCRSLRVSATATSLAAFLVLSRAPLADTPAHTSWRQHRSQGANQTTSSPSQNTDSAPVGTTQTQVEMQKPEISESLKRGKAEALWGLFIADSVAMPVHWFYNPSDIKNTYGGWLSTYTAPAQKHPSSILTISNAGGSGRSGSGSAKKNVIGDVILHDKLKYWTSRESSTHYHQGMKAGDSTLNAVMVLEMLETMNRVDPDLTQSQRDVQAAVLEDYVKFMTTPGSHNDTYAESFHRSFFKDWSDLSNPPKTGADILQFAETRYREKVKGSPDGQLVVIGALVPAIPWILHSAHRSETECARSTVDFIKLTHPVSTLTGFVDMYARLLHGVLHGHNLKEEVLKLLSHSELGGPQKREMVLRILDEAQQHPKGSERHLRVLQQGTAMLGSACYIEGALSSMLLLALEFHDDFAGGILANANCGGENCHRGAALGALLGAAAAARGQGVPQKWKEGLHSARPRLAQAIQDMNKI